MGEHMNDTDDELRPLIPENIWSEESFCLMRAKHMHGETSFLFENVPSYRTSREFWLSLLSGSPSLHGSAEVFLEVLEETPALRADTELTLAALRWSKNDGLMFTAAV